MQKGNALVHNDLIFDVGMSEGNDTAYYLAKGFRVVGVEADPIVYKTLVERFSSEIAAGRLTVIHRAAADVSGRKIRFLHNDIQQGISGTSRHPHVADGYTEFEVETICWNDIVAEHGIPRYCKVDIEGQERPFLEPIVGQQEIPTFFSVECHDLAPAEMLYKIGYRLFKLVDQVPDGGFINPNPAKEGNYVENPNWHHASGPFGLELPGFWDNYDEFKIAFENVVPLRHAGHWFDCHARAS
jgi:FkbM family methyltransferase